MNSRLFGYVGAVAGAAALLGCYGDPTESLRGGVASLTLEYDYREVVLADSVLVKAVERDGQGNPLQPTATISACTPAVASVSPGSAAPLLETAFYVKGVSYGTACVVAASGQLRDTMDVATFPFGVRVSAGPDTILSGTTGDYSHEYFDVRQDPRTGIPDPTWSIASSAVGDIVAGTGVVTGKAPGVTTVRATGPGISSAGVVGTKTITVIPGNFLGTLSPTSGGPTDTVTLTRNAAQPVFDNNTTFAVNNFRGFIIRQTPETLQAIVPGIGTASTVSLLMTGIGPDQWALATPFTSTTAAVTDPYDAINDDPATSPLITANGDYFIILSPDDVDDFFTITTGAVPDTITVNAAWFGATDVDILWRNAGNTAFVGNFAGATAANPQQSTVIIPANTTWRLWLNNYDPHGSPHDLVRVRVTGMN